MNTYLAAILTQCNLNNSLVLNCIEFVFDMEVS